MAAAPLTLALIPARSGSKSLPDKNIRHWAGKPLIAHSIEQARACQRIDRVVVSTDSARYAGIAREWGADTPFLRPAELAADDSRDLEVFVHALEWLRDHEGFEPDIVVHLRPTYPERDVADITAMVDLLIADPGLDSVRSVAPAPATPYKMWTRGADGLLRPVADLGDEAYNAPRQELPKAYLQNACIDAVRSRVVLEQRSMTGRRIHGYVMSADYDIDSHADLERLSIRGPAAPRHFQISLEDALAHLPGADASSAEPRRDVVRAVNRLHQAGHRITVRSNGDALAARAWLSRHDVRFDVLSSAAPDLDYLVDGRAVGLGAFLEIAAALAPEKHHATDS